MDRREAQWEGIDRANVNVLCAVTFTAFLESQRNLIACGCGVPIVPRLAWNSVLLVRLLAGCCAPQHRGRWREAAGIVDGILSSGNRQLPWESVNPGVG